MGTVSEKYVYYIYSLVGTDSDIYCISYNLWIDSDIYVAVRLSRKFSKSPFFQIHLFYNRITIEDPLNIFKISP